MKFVFCFILVVVLSLLCLESDAERRRRRKRPAEQEDTLTEQYIDIAEGQRSVILKCEMIKDAEVGSLIFTWQKDGEMLKAQTNSSLLLTKFTPADMGIYTCETTDGFSTASNLMIVRYLEKRKKPTELYVEVVEGQKSAILECDLILDEMPSPMNFTWKKDGELLLENSSSLILSPLSVLDMGNYTCETTKGSKKTSTTIIVEYEKEKKDKKDKKWKKKEDDEEDDEKMMSKKEYYKKKMEYMKSKKEAMKLMVQANESMKSIAQTLKMMSKMYSKVNNVTYSD